MARIAKSDVHSALTRAAENIKSAAKSDGIVSRDDIKQKLGDLKGTEKALTDVFYRFIDHRDAAPNARITAADVDKAVAYAKDKLVDAYDLNNNGLSKSEIAQMSRTGQLAVELASTLKQVAQQETANAIVGRVLQELGLDNMSVAIDDNEVLRQSTAFAGVDFEKALRAALNSFITDGDDPESPLGLCSEDIDIESGMPSDPQQLVRYFMNQPSTTLSLCDDVERSAEHGEKVDKNWIFSLYLDDLSDHGHWAVVARDESQGVYNYGFN